MHQSWFRHGKGQKEKATILSWEGNSYIVTTKCGPGGQTCASKLRSLLWLTSIFLQASKEWRRWDSMPKKEPILIPNSGHLAQGKYHDGHGCSHGHSEDTKLWKTGRSEWRTWLSCLALAFHYQLCTARWLTSSGSQCLPKMVSRKIPRKKFQQVNDTRRERSSLHGLHTYWEHTEMLLGRQTTTGKNWRTEHLHWPAFRKHMLPSDFSWCCLTLETLKEQNKGQLT